MLASRPLYGVFAFLLIALGGHEASAQVPPGLTGPQYFVNLTAINPNTDMTLGTAKLLFDTGAAGTALSRATAQSLGLLDAAANPVASLDSGVRVGVRNPQGQLVPGRAVSIGLRLAITGKDAAGSDIGNAVFPMDEKNLNYPIAGAANASNLFGTNVIKELPPEQRTPGGDLRYTAVLPSNPNRTVALGTLNPNLFDVATGQPVSNPLIAGTIPFIHDATVGSPTQTRAADLVYDTGSPYTIISQGLASSLDLQPVGTFDLFGLDPNTFDILSQDGYLGSTNPGPFTIVNISSLLLPTEGGVPLSFTDVLALENPFSMVTTNLFGTNVFPNAGLTAFEDFAANLIEVEPVPEPTSLSMLACWVSALALGCRLVKRMSI